MSDETSYEKEIRRRITKRYENRTQFFAHLAGFIVFNAVIWFGLNPQGLGLAVMTIVTGGWALGMTIHFVNFIMTESRERAIEKAIERERQWRGVVQQATTGQRERQARGRCPCPADHEHEHGAHGLYRAERDRKPQQQQAAHRAEAAGPLRQQQDGLVVAGGHQHRLRVGRAHGVTLAQLVWPEKTTVCLKGTKPALRYRSFDAGLSGS